MSQLFFLPGFKIEIKLFFNRIVPCHIYCSSGSRNARLLGYFPKYNRSENLPAYLSKFPFLPSSVKLIPKRMLSNESRSNYALCPYFQKTGKKNTEKQVIYVKPLITY